ncbi:MAG: hypothetical protein OXH31_10975, partial [Gammaproteobacteria bacterium]|nr:hypothetical protein [Gammaproteobacteria bacterium]
MTSTGTKSSDIDSSPKVPRINEGIPSDDYYANNVCKLLRFVVDRYRDLLNEEELKFSTSVLELSADAQRLYARILSRRGPIFLLAQFVYREVKHAASAFDELERNKLINRTAEVPTELLCQKLTLRQLREVFELQEFKGSKLALVSEIQDTYAEENILERIRQRLPWFELDQTDRIATFSLLFFGDRYQNLSTFVVHDLGILRLEQYTLDSENRQFNSRHDIDCYLDWWALSERMNEEESLETEQLLESIQTLKSSNTNRTLERQRSKLLNRIGRELERRGELLHSLLAYRHSSVHPARERQMRVFHRLDQIFEMEELRTEITEKPWTIEEKLFAEKFKCKSRVDVKYNTNEQVLMDPSTDNIEIFACSEFEARGWAAWHLENHLPSALFGLAYWDWVYAPIQEAFVNPFQIGPRDLYTPEFFAVRRELCVDPLMDSMPLIQRLEPPRPAGPDPA